MSSDLIAQLVHQYAALHKTYSLTSSFERVDRAFYISDFILEQGYVSPSFSHQLCARIAEIFMHWNGYLHGLVMPDAHHLIQMNESKVLSADEKKQLLSLMGRSMVFVSQNALFHARADPVSEARFIDEAVSFWEAHYQPRLVAVIETLRSRWSS